ncbi:apolipoprotein N-acyltransferase [Sphaerisporangium siamense]|uniref:Apolipoprotein N-acyltransferase n=1 Tax=Sphaerisporangium siamense TaxID=795645 RepID=A0A7W7DB48_9ACTN|nr:apolipoprotein N-acyltransferase [Sphaerisporangium siamense]MBB4703603.1 apolipoprotein N-acyltransferase [Sphaerisporangium siamense]GII82076.1 apolipoprotein N-acyltransferase [Sphaerisporangium siamense]
MAQRTAEKNDSDERAPGLPGRPPAARALPRAVACVAGGVLLYLAFPPVGLWFLAPVGVAALTLAVHRLPARRAAWGGYLGGLAFLLPALAWVRPIGEDAWLALVAIESLYFAVMAVGTGLVTRLRGWPVWAAALWVVQEWARGAFPFGGFPWVRLAFSQGHTLFTPYAAFGGAPLVTFAVALCGTLLAALALRLAGRRVLPPAAPLLAGVLAVPLLAYAVPGPGGAAAGTVRVGVIQGDVPGEGMGFLGDEPAVVLRNHADKTHDLARAVRAGRVARPDIVVWPENSTDIDPYNSSYAYGVIDAAVRDIGVPVLVGAVVRAPDGRHRYTRGLVWDPRTGPGAYYDKQKLVPFGEFVPYREILAKIVPRVGLVGLQSLPGTRDGALRMGPVTVGAVSCYEVAFDGVVRATVRAGGDPLVVQTNNATYSLTGQPPQQLAMSQLRAVEHGRAVITAATTGISASIDPSGEIRWRAPERVADMAVVTVPLRTGQTLATRAGGLPELGLCLAGLAAVALALAGRRRRGPAQEEPDGNQPG